MQTVACGGLQITFEFHHQLYGNHLHLKILHPHSEQALDFKFFVYNVILTIISGYYCRNSTTTSPFVILLANPYKHLMNSEYFFQIRTHSLDYHDSCGLVFQSRCGEGSALHHTAATRAVRRISRKAAKLFETAVP